MSPQLVMPNTHLVSLHLSIPFVVSVMAARSTGAAGCIAVNSNSTHVYEKVNSTQVKSTRVNLTHCQLDTKST